jgi:hypothetical protein
MRTLLKLIVSWTDSLSSGESENFYWVIRKLVHSGISIFRVGPQVLLVWDLSFCILAWIKSLMESFCCLNSGSFNFKSLTFCSISVDLRLSSNSCDPKFAD